MTDSETLQRTREKTQCVGRIIRSDAVSCLCVRRSRLPSCQVSPTDVRRQRFRQTYCRRRASCITATANPNTPVNATLYMAISGVNFLFYFYLRLTRIMTHWDEKSLWRHTPCSAASPVTFCVFFPVCLSLHRLRKSVASEQRKPTVPTSGSGRVSTDHRFSTAWIALSVFSHCSCYIYFASWAG